MMHWYDDISKWIKKDEYKKLHSEKRLNKNGKLATAELVSGLAGRERGGSVVPAAEVSARATEALLTSHTHTHTSPSGTLYDSDKLLAFKSVQDPA